MPSIINIAREYVEYYAKQYKEDIEDINDDMIFSDSFLFSFVGYLENPENGYRKYTREYFNENIKSYYVRYCNKYYKTYYGPESCIKYSIKPYDLMLHIVQTVASENYGLIEELLTN